MNGTTAVKLALVFGLLLLGFFVSFGFLKRIAPPPAKWYPKATPDDCVYFYSTNDNRWERENDLKSWGRQCIGDSEGVTGAWELRTNEGEVDRDLIDFFKVGKKIKLTTYPDYERQNGMLIGRGSPTEFLGGDFDGQVLSADTHLPRPYREKSIPAFKIEPL